MKPNTIRFSSLIALLVASANFAGCGDDGPKVTTETLAPGEDCLGGGTRVTVGEDVSVVCNGDPNKLEESVASGTAGNPCAWNATKITIRDDAGELSTEWYCIIPTLDELTPLGRIAHDYIQAFVPVSWHQTLSGDLCQDAFPVDGPAPLSTGAALVSPTPSEVETRLKALSACALPYLVVTPDGHDEFVEIYSCILDSISELEGCLFPLPETAPGTTRGECNNEMESIRDECTGAAEASEACTEGIDTDGIQLSMNALLGTLSLVMNNCQDLITL